MHDDGTTTEQQDDSTALLVGTLGKRNREEETEEELNEAKKETKNSDSDMDFSAIFEWGNNLADFENERAHIPQSTKEIMKEGPPSAISLSDSGDVTSEVYAKRKNNLPPVKLLRSKKLPTRVDKGRLHFSDFPEFEPNLTPKEILQLGSFGGTCFAPMISSVTGQSYVDAWKEFPADWFEGLDIENQVAAKKYNPKVNKYKVKCGGDLKEWEEAGWVSEIDPYGYFQWYCRFYLGRRCSDDPRQISRALHAMGSTGRWRKNLANKCIHSVNPLELAINDYSISPKIRQLLQHWGYQLTLDDLRKDYEQFLTNPKLPLTKH